MNDAINAHLTELISPSVYHQQEYYQSLGMQNRKRERSPRAVPPNFLPHVVATP
ncbi:MAG: hypothetical protein AB4042_01915 [Leptolyngbyaceae cyanobacterium]